MQHLFTWRTVKQFFGYGAVGLLNTFLNFLLVNGGIVLTGASKGPVFLLISAVAFCIIVGHSFLWNRYLIFVRDNPRELHREYIAFFLVSGATSLLNLSILHVMVDVIGPLWGFSAHIWANVALAVIIPVSVVCNFLGYKFFVFKDHV
jgi:putative flippase GtrA